MTKKQGPWIKSRILLDYLEKNFYDKNSRDISKLHSIIPPEEHAEKAFDFCRDNGYIKPDKIIIGKDPKGLNPYIITPKGLTFLQNLKEMERSNDFHNLQRVIASTGVILATAAILAFINPLIFEAKLIIQIIAIGLMSIATLTLIKDYFS